MKPHLYIYLNLKTIILNKSFKNKTSKQFDN